MSDEETPGQMLKRITESIQAVDLAQFYFNRREDATPEEKAKLEGIRSGLLVMLAGAVRDALAQEDPL